MDASKPAQSQPHGKRFSEKLIEVFAIEGFEFKDRPDEAIPCLGDPELFGNGAAKGFRKIDGAVAGDPAGLGKQDGQGGVLRVGPIPVPEKCEGAFDRIGR